jgi:alkyl hydroperoxide reductase subunit AhpC
MLENSSFAFFEIHKLPTFKLFTFVNALSIALLSRVLSWRILFSYPLYYSALTLPVVETW